MKETIIGIDLGTTNSCVSFWDNDKVVIIENANGGRTTPSIVAYTNSDVLVGDSAKRQAITNPLNTIFAVKRLIGHKFEDPEIQSELNKSPYKIVRSNKGDAWVEANGKQISPEQVSSEVLKFLKKAAEDYLGHPVKQAIITVPAYFNDSQRQATKDAGKLAGLEVKRIINEPTAAALAYGEDKRKSGTIAVYDLGGGTFDISIIDISEEDGEKTFEVLSTNGDTKLGGEDFDNVIINYLNNEFKAIHNVDLLSDPMAKQRLKEAAEKAKIELSTMNQTNVNLPFIYVDSTGPKHLVVDLTRAKLEILVENLVQRTIEPCRKALEDANLTLDQIDEVILVGGMTRMPLVQESVKQFFKKDPRRDINPDEAVSIGAAIQGSVLSGKKGDILLLDVTPLSIGIETLGGIMAVVIPRNSAIPIQGTQTFTTSEDNQTSVEVKIFQGERRETVHNKLLGQFVLNDIPPLPQGQAQIEINLNIDADGILKVTAKEKTTGRSADVIIQSKSGLSDIEIQRIIKESEVNAQKDLERVQLINTRNHIELSLHSLFKEKGEDFYSEAVKQQLIKLRVALKESESAQELDELVLELRKLVAKDEAEHYQKQQNNENKEVEKPENKEDENIETVEAEVVK